MKYELTQQQKLLDMFLFLTDNALIRSNRYLWGWTWRVDVILHWTSIGLWRSTVDFLGVVQRKWNYLCVKRGQFVDVPHEQNCGTLDLSLKYTGQWR